MTFYSVHNAISNIFTCMWKLLQNYITSTLFILMSFFTLYFFLFESTSFIHPETLLCTINQIIFLLKCAQKWQWKKKSKQGQPPPYLSPIWNHCLCSIWVQPCCCTFLKKSVIKSNLLLQKNYRQFQVQILKKRRGGVLKICKKSIQCLIHKTY